MNGPGSSGCWTIGLINAKAKYLTAETFGFKINANGERGEEEEEGGGEGALLLLGHLGYVLMIRA